MVIHNISGNVMEFSVLWYRIASIRHVTAYIDGDTASFDCEDEYGVHASGTMEIHGDDGSITLTLKEFESAFITPGTYTYDYFGTEEEYVIAYNKSVLLMNRDNWGWAKTGEIDGDGFGGMVLDNVRYPLYIRFFEDGTCTYWKRISVGGVSEYQTYHGSYKVGADTITIDGCDYKLSAYTAGNTMMDLYALGDYAVDLSGYYFCGENTEYEWLCKHMP